jgi:hypothetical protein
VFNDDFYSKLSGVCTALDNVEARLYMDQVSTCTTYITLIYTAELVICISTTAQCGCYSTLSNQV